MYSDNIKPSLKFIIFYFMYTAQRMAHSFFSSPFNEVCTCTRWVYLLHIIVIIIMYENARSTFGLVGAYLELELVEGRGRNSHTILIDRIERESPFVLNFCL